MVALPNPTVDSIYELYKDNEPDRPYLGGSQIGDECGRRLWYSFRWVGKAPFEPRMLRLFDTGKREELRIIEELRKTGVEVFDSDGEKQYRFSAVDGHFSCGLDGVVLGLKEAPKTPHVLEIKTHNKKSFDALEKNGVDKAKPEHVAQMQVYMGLAELTRAAYIAICKDDDRIYFERIEFDKKQFEALLLKAKRIIYAETPPERISEDPKYFQCAWCGFKDICHGTKRPKVNCRTCVHSSPTENGQWKCPQKEKCEPCDEHLYIPDLLPWAKPIDGTPEWILYEMPDGRKFLNCAALGFPAMDVPHYSSKEIEAIQLEAICNPQIELARTTMEGRIVSA